MCYNEKNIIYVTFKIFIRITFKNVNYDTYYIKL